MVSRRYRDNNSVSSRVGKLASDVEKARIDTGLKTDEVVSENFVENSVDRMAIAPNAVGSEQIDRGAVGTNELGIVNEITTDTPLKLSGASYVQPSATPVPLMLNQNSQVVQGSSVFRMPPGIVLPFGGGVPPANFVFARGQALSRVTYAALFVEFGTTYGIGDGSTTFNVPNLTGKTIVGYDNGQPEFATLGQTGGAKTHTLSVAEMPSHQHSATDVRNASNAVFTTSGGTGMDNATVTANLTTATGGGGAHNNLQPYIVLNYIISIG